MIDYLIVNGYFNIVIIKPNRSVQTKQGRFKSSWHAREIIILFELVVCEEDGPWSGWRKGGIDDFITHPRSLLSPVWYLS